LLSSLLLPPFLSLQHLKGMKGVLDPIILPLQCNMSRLKPYSATMVLTEYSFNLNREEEKGRLLNSSLSQLRFLITIPLFLWGIRLPLCFILPTQFMNNFTGVENFWETPLFTYEFEMK
jgi:hypothetical protein